MAFDSRLLRCAAIVLLVVTGCNDARTPLDGSSGVDILPPMHQTSPEWSPDGRIAYRDHGVVCVEVDRAIVDSALAGIWVIENDGNRHRITACGDLPSWSPRGDELVFEAGGQILRMSDDGTNVVQLTFAGANYHPDWSPDGGWIVYDSDYMADNILIWRMRADGSERTNLGIRGQGNWGMPAWSPDGSRIVHVRDEELYTMTFAGDSAMAVGPSGPRIWTPVYSPDGSRLCFSSRLTLIVINPDGSDARQISDYKGYHPTWSPDGGRIAYVRFDSRSKPEENGVLWVIDLESRVQTQLTHPWPVRCE